jgi:hypothetical protein
LDAPDRLNQFLIEWLGGVIRGTGQVSQAYDIAGITNTVGAPSFAFFAKILP